MKKRNVIVAAILAVVIAGSGIGGYYGFRSMNRPVTMVYSVNELNNGYWGDNMNLDGMITSDASQNIYLSSEQKVKEVLVKEGDTVKEGDVIMKYDTTAKELELETMELEQKQNALKLDQARKQLDQLKKTKPVSEGSMNPSLDVPEVEEPIFPGIIDPGTEDPGEFPEPTDTPTPTPTPEPTDTPIPTPTPEPTYDDAILYDGEQNPLTENAVPYKGTGAKEDPMVFLCSPGTVITGGFFNRMAGFGQESEERNSVWFRLEIREGNKAAGNLQTVWEQDGMLISEPYEETYRTVFKIGDKTGKSPILLFEAPLSSVTAVVGEPVKLNIKIREEDNTSYRYQWFHKAVTEPEKGQENGWVELTEQEGRTELYLEQAKPEDEGLYMVQITAGNAYGTANAVATANLALEQPPTATPSPEPSSTPTATPSPEPSSTPIATPSPESGEEDQKGETSTPASIPEEAPVVPETTVIPGSTSTPAPTDIQQPTAAPEESGTSETLPADGQKMKMKLASGKSIRFLSNSGSLFSLGSGKTENQESESNSGKEVNLGALKDSYTKEELKKAIADKEKEIRDLQLNQREAELKIRNAKKELDNQTVKATVTGVVKKVGDPQKPSQDGSSFIQIDSQQGLYVTGYVSELFLDQVVPGTPVQVTSWSSGSFSMATIKEISPYPSENYSSYGNGAQASYYPFIALLDEEAEGFQNMESVSISMTVGGDTASQNGIYLNKMFIREENGQKYVYVRGEDNSLERRNVKTGKVIWGSTYEIKEGLTTEDYIAFPYAKNSLEGTQTEESTVSELYNY